jgi:hypothetical protein
VKLTVYRLVGVLCLWTVLAVIPVSAQEPQPPSPKPTDIHEHVDVTARLLTPTREASGTSWLPQATPMYGVHRAWRGWDLRVNGVAFVQFVYEPGDRHRTGGASTHQTGSVNWGMAMARRNAGAGRLGLRAMLSVEPLTVRGCGSLSFLATGEVCEGDTIHDRQQQHDLVMELAVDYDRPLFGEWRWQLYAGLAGEPALGPVGYPHRPSAMENPTAPMTHHWFESTRIAFGVITAGVQNRRWKAEASAFNGRAPDDSRVDLDLGALDSFAARISYLATERLAFQVSAGRLHEATLAFYQQPQITAGKVTASATYHRPLGPSGIWATTLGYALNDGREVVSGSVVDVRTAAGLLESSVTIAERHTAYTRMEVAALPAHHLHAVEFGAAAFTTGKLQAGYVFHFAPWGGIVPGIGGTVSLSLLPPAFAPRYSGRVAPSFGMFFNIRPARHAM